MIGSTRRASFVLASLLGIATATGCGAGISTTGTGGSGTDPATGGRGTGGGASGSGGAGSGGAPSGTGGQGQATGGRTATGGATVPGTGGRGASGSGGSGTGGGAPTDGGAPPSAGACTIGAFPAADPATKGPFTTVTENNVGPAAGVGSGDGGAAPMFTMFRPADLRQSGLCHPVITWGNGTGSTPSTYRALLNHLASHGFVVIASNSPQVGQGTPAPMLVGVTWVLEQNADPASPLYQRIDSTHIGATGHSQGGFATSSAGGDARITTVVPLCGSSNQRNLHGPAMLFCGGMDTTVPCSGSMNAFNAITTQPVMLANYLTADHANWLSFGGSSVKPVEVAVTAWMRVHLMADAALRGRFYGPACTLCGDTGWQIMRKMMDQ